MVNPARTELTGESLPPLAACSATTPQDPALDAVFMLPLAETEARWIVWGRSMFALAVVLFLAALGIANIG